MPNACGLRVGAVMLGDDKVKDDEKMWLNVSIHGLPILVDGRLAREQPEDHPLGLSRGASGPATDSSYFLALAFALLLDVSVRFA